MASTGAMTGTIGSSNAVVAGNGTSSVKVTGTTLEVSAAIATLTYDPDAGLAPLEFSVSKNLNAKNDAERAEPDPGGAESIAVVGLAELVQDAVGAEESELAIALTAVAQQIEAERVPVEVGAPVEVGDVQSDVSRTEGGGTGHFHSILTAVVAIEG